MWYGQRRSCRSRGFSLTEMLVGITLMLMITFPLLPALKASADKTVSYSEDTRAHVRIS
ncbi:MAG: prepilin-type N-terminal cleavage/methylation domain-containing protein, partial [Synergistaceae bacterium]|nr:prepilin-type N-terminal cleavage/methylation domain-containing protein [Synergistaceae bacterium]